MNWKKSSRCKTDSDMCVEVSVGDNTVGVRDTKNLNAEPLTCTRVAWSGFLAFVKDREVHS